MAKQIINIGRTANDRSGDPLRTAFEKVNSNFTELYSAIGADIQIPVQTGNDGKYLTTNGTTLSWAEIQSGGVNIGDFGEGFSLTNANKIVTNKLYSTNLTQSTQHYRLELDTNGVVHLPDQSIINGATLKTVPGNWAGITAGPAGHDEDSWVWVDNDGATIATKYSTDAYTWIFNNSGILTLPGTGTIKNPSSSGAATGTISTFTLDADGNASGIDNTNEIWLPTTSESIAIQSGWIITFANNSQQTVVSNTAGIMPPHVGHHRVTWTGNITLTSADVWPLTIESADYSAGTTTKSLELTPDGTTTWTFSKDGRTQFPVATIPTHSYGAVGDKAGMVAYSGDYIYYCKQDYVDNSTNIWVRTAWTGTNW